MSNFSDAEFERLNQELMSMKSQLYDARDREAAAAKRQQSAEADKATGSGLITMLIKQ